MFHWTIHNQFFSLPIGYDLAGAGGGGKWSAQGLDTRQGHEHAQAHTLQEQHRKIWRKHLIGVPVVWIY